MIQNRCIAIWNKLYFGKMRLSSQWLDINKHRIFETLVAFLLNGLYFMEFRWTFLFAEFTWLIVFGLHTFLPSVVRY